VEAVFEGPSSEVEALVNWMRQGPRHARVETADVTMEQPEGLSGFRIP
jgi:acylphosphatase